MRSVACHSPRSLGDRGGRPQAAGRTKRLWASGASIEFIVVIGAVEAVDNSRSCWSCWKLLCTGGVHSDVVSPGWGVQTTVSESQLRSDPTTHSFVIRTRGAGFSTEELVVLEPSPGREGSALLVSTSSTNGLSSGEPDCRCSSLDSRWSSGLPLVERTPVGRADSRWSSLSRPPRARCSSGPPLVELVETTICLAQVAVGRACRDLPPALNSVSSGVPAS